LFQDISEKIVKDDSILADEAILERDHFLARKIIQ
jgi:hypothetical protein